MSCLPTHLISNEQHIKDTWIVFDVLLTVNLTQFTPYGELNLNLSQITWNRRNQLFRPSILISAYMLTIFENKKQRIGMLGACKTCANFNHVNVSRMCLWKSSYFHGTWKHYCSYEHLIVLRVQRTYKTTYSGACKSRFSKLWYAWLRSY